MKIGANAHRPSVAYDGAISSLQTLIVDKLPLLVVSSMSGMKMFAQEDNDAVVSKLIWVANAGGLTQVDRLYEVGRIVLYGLSLARNLCIIPWSN